MRLLIVIPNFEPAWRYGGVMKSAVFLARGLHAIGVDVTVYTMNTATRGELLDVPLQEKVVLSGVNVFYFAPSIFRARDFHSSSLIRFMERTIDDFDAVYISAMWQYVGIAAARVARRHSVPFVLAVHGSFSRMKMRRKWLKKNLYARVMMRSALRNCTGIHFCSEYERRTFALTSGRPYMIVPNPVDDRFIRDKSLATKPAKGGGPKTLITAGRPDPIKGYDLCIRTIRTLKDRGQDVHLKILGVGDSAYGDELRQLARELDVDDRVAWIPFVTGDALLQEYSGADAYISLGRSENFCIAVAEALCLGLPAICAKTVGISELVEEHGLGRVCALDPESGADAVHSLLLTGPVCNRAFVRETAGKLFDKESVARKFLEGWARISGGAIGGYGHDDRAGERR